MSPNTASSGRGNLAEALVKAQAECENVAFNRTNPHFKSRYADLAAVRDAIVPVFAKHGLAILQVPTSDESSNFYLETRLIHSSGEEMIWSFPLPCDVNKMQSIGSAISYARRYTLSAVAGIASEEDDDGNAAQDPNGGRHTRGNVYSPAPAPSGVGKGGGIEL